MRGAYGRPDPPWWFVVLIVVGLGLLAIDWALSASTIELVGTVVLVGVVLANLCLLIQYQRGSHA